MADDVDLDLLKGGDIDCEVSNREQNADLSSPPQGVGSADRNHAPVGHIEPSVPFRRRIKSSQDSENSDWSSSSPIDQVFQEPHKPQRRSSFISRKRISKLK